MLENALALTVLTLFYYSKLIIHLVKVYCAHKLFMKLFGYTIGYKFCHA